MVRVEDIDLRGTRMDGMDLIYGKAVLTADERDGRRISGEVCGTTLVYG
jgi:hypothetical protein